MFILLKMFILYEKQYLFKYNIFFLFKINVRKISFEIIDLFNKIYKK